MISGQLQFPWESDQGGSPDALSPTNKQIEHNKGANSYKLNTPQLHSCTTQITKYST
jgi:hypothetical protein